jgi:hypothetical protein
MELHDRLDELEAQPRTGWMSLYLAGSLVVFGVLAAILSIGLATVEAGAPLIVPFAVSAVCYVGIAAFFLRRVLRARREIRELRREIRARAPDAFDASRTEGWRSWLPAVPDRVVAVQKVLGFVGVVAAGVWMADALDPRLMYGILFIAGGLAVAWKEWTGSPPDPDTAREEV